MGLVAFVSAMASVAGESDLAAARLASEFPVPVLSVASTRQDSENRPTNSTSEMLTAKSDAISLTQRQEYRVACRSVRYERCDG